MTTAFLADPTLLWLFFGGFAAMAGIMAVMSGVRNRKRRNAYTEYALTRGYGFEHERPNGEQRFADVFDPFTQGHGRKWGYTIAGTKNHFPFTAFEYRWTTGGGKSSQTHRIGAMVWQDERAALPKFVLSPEGFWSRVGQFLGMQDIDFPESPEFSKLYRLKGPDEPAIRQLFNAEIRRFFEATPNQHVAGGGRSLFWYRHGLLPDTEQFDEWLEQGDHVRRRFFAT